MICLDTNVIIAVINRRSELIRRRFYEAVAEEPVFVSTIVLYELHFGIAKSQRREASRAELDLFLALGVEFLTFRLAIQDRARAA